MAMCFPNVLTKTLHIKDISMSRMSFLKFKNNSDFEVRSVLHSIGDLMDYGTAAVFDGNYVVSASFKNYNVLICKNDQILNVITH